MLDRLRENSRSFGSYLIFGIIILVFVVFFGPGGQSCTDLGSGQSVTWAAKVDGKEIPLKDFRSEYDALYRQYQAQMGENFDPKLAQQMGIRTSAIDRLVTRKLLIEQAKKMGIAVTDEEVAKAIREEPAFQKEGHFDFATYREALRAWQGISPARFEDSIRENLLVGKVISQMKLSAKVSDDEIRTAFEREGDRASVAFVRLAAKDLEGEVAVSDDEAKAHLATEDGKKRVADEYEAKAWRYKTPKRVRAQHILVKVEEDAPEAEANAAEEKILAARKEIEGGADFGEVAKRVSEDQGTKEKGGDLGLFGPGSMVKPFEDAAMAMEPGAVSDPVRSRFGYHLIKVNEVVPASEKTLAEVEVELAKELLVGEAAKKEARQRAEQILAKARESSLADLYPASDAVGEDHEGPVVESTPPFQVASDFVPKLGVAPELVRSIVEKDSVGVVDRVFEVSGNLVVAQVVTREKPDPSKLDDGKKKELRERLTLRKQNELVESFIGELKAGAKVETNDLLVSAGF